MTAQIIDGTAIAKEFREGVASLDDDTIQNTKELMASADEMLYTSKENGRNRVTSAHHR